MLGVVDVLKFDFKKIQQGKMREEEERRSLDHMGSTRASIIRITRFSFVHLTKTKKKFGINFLSFFLLKDDGHFKDWESVHLFLSSLTLLSSCG